MKLEDRNTAKRPAAAALVGRCTALRVMLSAA